MINIVAAIGKNRELGKGNELLWHIPDDLKRFKALTTGHPVIMGRKTFESIGRPLPNRTNIVVTREDWAHEGVIATHSIEEALDEAKKIDSNIFVIGGAQIYEQTLPYTDKLHLTLIEDKKPADIFFPEYQSQFPKKVFEEKHEWNGLSYTWVDLVK